MSAQHIDYLPLFPAQLPDSFKNRQVSLTRPVVFQTLPSTYPNASIRSDAPRERVNQSGLADASFTRNKYDLPFSSEHLLQPASHPRQGFITPNDSLMEICVELRRTQSRMGVFAFQLFCLHRFALRDLTDEAIASAMGGFNKPWRLWIVAENFSQLANGNFEDTFSNEGSRPNCVKKFLFCDELARMPKQVIQYCKGLGSELYRLLALPQAFVSQVETKRVEDDAFFVRHDAPTLRKFYGRIMTLNAMREYSPSFMEGWQYKAAFVIHFRPESNVESKQLEGRVEHVASSKATRFHSLDELFTFIADVLAQVRDSART